MEHRYETTSPEGFVQLLACNLLPHGYWFYVTGRIPDDISVVTYNNSRFAATSSMPMTTVGVPTGLYAEETVKLILEGTAAREAGADLLRQVMLPPEMIVRQSSGPVGTEDGKRKTRKSKEPKNRGTAERRTEKAERGTRTRRAGRRHG